MGRSLKQLINTAKYLPKPLFFMAQDSDALSVTINYEGGSITMPVGNAKSLFGEDGYELLRPQGEEVTVSRKKHERVRVIGGPTTTIDSYSFTYKKWPRTRKSNNAGGQEIVMSWEGSEGNWVARMNGTAADLGTFLNNSAPKAVVFNTAGSKYGPFIRGGS